MWKVLAYLKDMKCKTIGYSEYTMKYDKHYDSTNIKYIGHFISANVNGLNSILNKKKKIKDFQFG